MSRSYTDLSKIDSYKERYRYLKLSGEVGKETFGWDRYLNQKFYSSAEWKKVRDMVIIRDDGCDMGLKDYPIKGKVMIHHMNPITEKDIYLKKDYILDPEYLVCVSYDTHNAIHYGDESLLASDPVMRKPNDTCPWKR